MAESKNPFASAGLSYFGQEKGMLGETGDALKGLVAAYLTQATGLQGALNSKPAGSSAPQAQVASLPTGTPPPVPMGSSPIAVPPVLGAVPPATVGMAMPPSTIQTIDLPKFATDDDGLNVLRSGMISR